ncbi:hypothetical protein F4808DRAFT_304531 [Astrocystis sublimbata]|nr:hypothetical protein F4808DRAFT_304531 [Astrocystis sublimbata]
MAIPHPNSPEGSSRPARPSTARNYNPTPVGHTIGPGESLQQLRNRDQDAPLRVQIPPREQFTSFSQMEELGLATARPEPSPKPSLKSRVSGLAAKTKLKRAITKTMKVMSIPKKTGEGSKSKGKGKESLSRSSSDETGVPIWKRRKLPPVAIPDLRIEVQKALLTACSTDSRSSSGWSTLGTSPTSRVLRDYCLDSDLPPDVRSEFHNMYTARRRVRKSEFGKLVQEYRDARSGWDSSFSPHIDNPQEKTMIRRMTNAHQAQKDHATTVVQQDSTPYPRMHFVEQPGCTLPLYRQEKSAYKDPCMLDERR